MLRLKRHWNLKGGEMEKELQRRLETLVLTQENLRGDTERPLRKTAEGFLQGAGGSKVHYTESQDRGAVKGESFHRGALR